MTNAISTITNGITNVSSKWYMITNQKYDVPDFLVNIFFLSAAISVFVYGFTVFLKKIVFKTDTLSTWWSGGAVFILSMGASLFIPGTFYVAVMPVIGLFIALAAFSSYEIAIRSFLDFIPTVFDSFKNIMVKFTAPKDPPANPPTPPAI